MWATCHPFPELADDTDWVQLTPTVVGTALAYAGLAGKTLLPMAGLPYEWVRIKYADTSGTATVRAYATLDDQP